MARRIARCSALIALLLAAGHGSAANFALPAGDANVVGHVLSVRLDGTRNTLLDVARHYDLGYDEIVAANPGVSIWLPGAGSRIVVPTEFDLPPKPWVGIVINVAQRRLFYFPAQRRSVVTFPIGIAQAGWPTPLGRTRIIAKFRDPSWIVPEDIRAQHLRAGETKFPRYFPPGPENPMGMLAMETGFPEIFIHGTDRPWGVGMRVSYGCLHLYPEDAAYLFERLRVGTPVRIMDQPVSVGEREGRLYLSAATPLGEHSPARDYLTRAVRAVIRFQGLGTASARAVDWDRVIRAAEARRIAPAPISPRRSLAVASAPLPATNYDFAPYGVDANGARVPATR